MVSNFIAQIEPRNRVMLQTAFQQPLGISEKLRSVQPLMGAAAFIRLSPAAARNEWPPPYDTPVIPIFSGSTGRPASGLVSQVIMSLRSSSSLSGAAQETSPPELPQPRQS